MRCATGLGEAAVVDLRVMKSPPVVPKLSLEAGFRIKSPAPPGPPLTRLATLRIMLVIENLNPATYARHHENYRVYVGGEKEGLSRQPKKMTGLSAGRGSYFVLPKRHPTRITR